MGENVSIPPEVERRLACELAALVVARRDPDELVILDQVAEKYFADPQALLRPQRKDTPLGSGLDLTLVAPYALAAALPAVQYLLSILLDGAKDAATDAVADRVRGLFRRSPALSSPPPDDVLTAAQARTIQAETEKLAQASGLSGDEARALADALVDSLITKS